MDGGVKGYVGENGGKDGGKDDGVHGRTEQYEEKGGGVEGRKGEDGEKN